MELVHIKDRKESDDFLLSAAQFSGGGAEFLASGEWGKILKREGEEVFYLGLKDRGKLILTALLVKRALSLFPGQPYFYWYAPRGPIFGPEVGREALDFFYGEVKKIDSRALFLRIEPPRLLESGFKLKKTISFQPARTLILDLRLKETDLLAAMGQKTRYNIRLAEKKGVRIVPGRVEDFADFWRLMKVTGERDDFRLHAAEHYRNLLAEATSFIRLYFAEFESRKIAAGLFGFFGGRATYLHGASDNRLRQVMAPYLLQWEVIKEARAGGYDFYDFYGIDEQKWPGVTRFKRGFGGEVKEYPGTFDVIFRSKLYSFYEFLRKVRRYVGNK